ncbi:MAG: polysaccharide deacetylase family protein [Ignavibacteriales bacterium]|nr:polysaccharide deacetylase family protein [Ignavibacteriales bacterium]
MMPVNGNSRNLKLLLYHRIVNNKQLCNAHWSCVHVNEFQKQLDLLDRWGYSAVTLEDFRLSQERKLMLPKKPIIISFDDGYLDTYDLAFPLLQEYGMKAVVFVLGERKIKSNYWVKYLGLPDVPLMKAEHVVELHESGIEIGSHTMTHARLPFLREDEAWEEIFRSRMLLEILINAPVHSFSYPYGLLNPKIKQMVVNAGFKSACAVQSGPATFGKDLYRIRRMPILNTTNSIGFAMRVLAPYQYYGWIRWRISNALFGQYGRYGANGKYTLRELVGETPAAKEEHSNADHKF